MMKKILIPSLAAALMAVGCKTDISGSSYSAGSVGNVNRAVEATVISKREVFIHGSNETGAAVGATGGAIAGGNAGGDDALGIIAGAIGGAVVGGLIGGAAEKDATNQKGIEYVVKTENGVLLTVVQGHDPPIENGQKVIVLYGSRSRLIPVN
jgi:outer membrane lipoprotein SlyB